MPIVALYNTDGSQVGEITLSENIFGIEINEAVLHQVVKAQLANKRQGTQSALTRAEVRGGGIKPWKQKGTGRARQGSIRAPQWVKGGVVFAPKPRDYRINVPKKIRRLAMKSALTSKVIDHNIIVLEGITLTQAKTREMVKVLENLKIDQKVLMVLPEKNAEVERAARNIPNIKTVLVNTLNVLDILNYDKFVITQEAVQKVEEVYA